jgi:hypothetical protein
MLTITQKSFKYRKVIKRTALPIPKLEISMLVPIPQYAGTIDGLQSRHGEENLLNAAFQTGSISSYAFRLAVGAPRNFPGWKELDFLFSTKSGEYVAVQVRDFEFVHKGNVAEATDTADDIYIVGEFANEGISLKGNRVYTISAGDLNTLDDAKRKVMEVFQ